MALEDLVISLLEKSPADQYSLYRQARVSMSEMTRTIVRLQGKKIIHVIRYRKSERSGLDVPVYSLSANKHNKLDVHGLLAGITSERLVEYKFLARNLPSLSKKSKILDVGAAGSGLVRAISEFGIKWQVFGIDLARDCDGMMDARSTGFRNRTFDCVICISTLEHIGLDHNVSDENGDSKAVDEISRVLKIGGSAIVTMPYGKAVGKSGFRVYNKRMLANLVRPFQVSKSEFYCYNAGKWTRCSQAAAGRAELLVPLHFHSSACACLLLKKK